MRATIEEKKTLLITTAICLLPIVLGLRIYELLPDTIQTHLVMSGEPSPSNFWNSKNFVIYGIPCIYALIHFVYCYLQSQGRVRKRYHTSIWLLPILSLLCGSVFLINAISNDVQPILLIAPSLVGVFTIKLGLSIKFSDKNKRIFNRVVIILGFTIILIGYLFVIKI